MGVTEPQQSESAGEFSLTGLCTGHRFGAAYCKFVVQIVCGLDSDQH